MCTLTRKNLFLHLKWLEEPNFSKRDDFFYRSTAFHFKKKCRPLKVIYGESRKNDEG